MHACPKKGYQDNRCWHSLCSSLGVCLFESLLMHAGSGEPAAASQQSPKKATAAAAGPGINSSSRCEAGHPATAFCW